jgi:putative SOS response-associated peptidase YedK
MCARYRLKLSLRHIAELLGLSVTELFEEFSERPRLNISISQPVPIVMLDNGQRKLAMAEWGFLAPWDKSKRIFNAAGETVAVKPTFRESFKARRCLIPADGFYEWPNKQPTIIHFADDRLFCFAGLWVDGTMTMITCAPNDFMQPIHHRMPAILRDKDCVAWLDPQSPKTELQSLIATRDWHGMQTDSIAKLVPDNLSPSNLGQGDPSNPMTR